MRRLAARGGRRPRHRPAAPPGREANHVVLVDGESAGLYEQEHVGGWIELIGERSVSDLSGGSVKTGALAMAHGSVWDWVSASISHSKSYTLYGRILIYSLYTVQRGGSCTWIMGCARIYGLTWVMADTSCHRVHRVSACVTSFFAALVTLLESPCSGRDRRGRRARRDHPVCECVQCSCGASEGL